MPPKATPVHNCPAGCGRLVEQRMYACKQDWFRLPKVIRDEIWASYRSEDRAWHIAAMAQGAVWYHNNPRETETLL